MIGYVLRIVIRLYKWLISPWLPVACRFTPTCSDYAMQALDAHGTLKGSALALKRIMRCHPFGAFGYDPIPARKE